MTQTRIFKYRNGTLWTRNASKLWFGSSKTVPTPNVSVSVKKYIMRRLTLQGQIMTELFAEENRIWTLTATIVELPTKKSTISSVLHQLKRNEIRIEKNNFHNV